MRDAEAEQGVPSPSWQEVEHWFHLALDWPPDQRLDRLRGHEVSQPVIAEVMSLLAAAETPEGFSETSPHLLAMDWTEQHEASSPGKRITTYCDRHRLDLRRRLRVFVEVCRDVERVHSRGILHHDLRPFNIRLSGDPGAPQLQTLGLESEDVADAAEKDMPGPPKRGEHLEYMSPEAMTGGRRAMDNRSNVYSLGVLLWELLIGLRPFSGGQLLHLTDVSTVATQLAPPSLRFQRIAEEPREAIAERRRRDSRGLLRDLRPDLDWIASRATHLEPAKRYPVVGELAAEVEGWLDGRRAPSRPVGFWGRVGEGLRRRLGGMG